MVFTTQLCKLPFSYTKGHTFQGVWLENPPENKPSCLQYNTIIKLLLGKGADSIYMNFRYVTSSLCMNCDLIFPLLDAKRQRSKMRKYWQKEKRQSIIYQNYCLRSFHSMCSRNSTLSILKNIFVTYFSQDCKLALLQHFLGIFITICRATSGFVNWTAVIHHMNPKCEQHAKENHTKIKLNYTWHLIFQKKNLFVGIFTVGFFSILTFKSAKIDVWKKTAESRPLDTT